MEVVVEEQLLVVGVVAVEQLLVVVVVAKKQLLDPEEVVGVLRLSMD